MPEEKQETSDSKAEKNQPLAVQEKRVETQHSIKLHGKKIDYTAVAGTIVLYDEEDKKAPQPKGEIFYIAYTVNNVKDNKTRPVTFSFNGGPGSSSVWMHLGLLGPRRVPMSDENNEMIRPPYQVEDNEFSILDQTDLVFIDPVGTGFSRPVEGEEGEQFWNFTKDIESVGEFIRLYTTRNKRWASPKFLIGESYGTTRAAGLSGYLQDRHGMFLNGIMLVSVILNFQTARFEHGNDLPYPLFLPTYAATAWYHKKLQSPYQSMPLAEFLTEVTDFAESEYTVALMRGAKMSGDERNFVIQRLAAFTGLSPTYLEQTNMRINIHRFCRELMRNEGKSVGRLDSRLTSYNRDEAGETNEFDPAFPIITGVYAGSLNQYLREELEFESDLPYEILSFKVFPSWKYTKFMNSYVNTAETLRSAMTKNPHLRIFVANGYYDLATPFFATEYTLNHLELKEHLLKNITMSYYEAGHMMYIHPPSLAKMRGDLIAFLAEAA